MRDMQESADAVGRRVKVDLSMPEAAALISWTDDLGEGI